MCTIWDVLVESAPNNINKFPIRTAADCLIISGVIVSFQASDGAEKNKLSHQLETWFIPHCENWVNRKGAARRCGPKTCNCHPLRPASCVFTPCVFDSAAQWHPTLTTLSSWLVLPILANLMFHNANTIPKQVRVIMGWIRHYLLVIHCLTVRLLS